MPGPLEGIRVLDFTIAQQGAYATLLLRRHGRRGDQGRAARPRRGRPLLGIDRRNGFSAYFLAINRGKKGIAVDITAPRRAATPSSGSRATATSSRTTSAPASWRSSASATTRSRREPGRHLRLAPPPSARRARWARKPGNDILAQAVGGLMSVTGEAERRTRPARHRRPRWPRSPSPSASSPPSSTASARASASRSSARCWAASWPRSPGSLRTT